MINVNFKNWKKATKSNVLGNAKLVNQAKRVLFNPSKKISKNNNSRAKPVLVVGVY